MDKICIGCYFNRGFCNRLVIPGGFGWHDRVASDFLENNECKYKKEGKSKETVRPNFENS